MCLILFAYRVHTDYPLVIAANRDELYARPALSAHNWEDKPDVFAGRDLTAAEAPGPPHTLTNPPTGEQLHVDRGIGP